jgi:hypothetical protein
MRHDGENRTQKAVKPATATPSPGILRNDDLAGRRYGTGTTLQSPQKSGLPAAPPSPKSAFEDLATRLHANQGVRIDDASARLGVPPHNAAAVILAECQLLPTRIDDRMPIRFEPHAFFTQTGRWLVATHKDQAAEYRTFHDARGIDASAAFACVRMGMAQISGLEAHAAGFDSAQAMMGAMEKSPDAQVDGLFRLVESDGGLREAMQKGDWRQLALLRAGPGYGAVGYHDALAAWSEAYKQVAKAAAKKPGGGDDDDKPKKRRKD